jgi:Holliday junction DNA helicase RuvB
MSKRERLISGVDAIEEEPLVKTLRPHTLAELIGKHDVVEPLKIAMDAAKGRGETLDHVLFHGPPGLGKTTLAHIIRQEMGVDIIATTGPALKRAGDLMGILTNLKVGDVLFIDEIHRLSPAVEEYLYPAMEDFKVDFIIDRGANARILNFRLQQFTMVGATTMAGLLSRPLRDRFGLVYRLDFYGIEELCAIIHRSAGILGVEIDEEGVSEIGRRARGTPRVANRLLRRVRDYAQVHGKGAVDKTIADKALTMEGVDSQGLDPLDRAFLETIIRVYQGGPVGIEALAATLNEEVSTLQEVVEPYLLKIGFVARTPSGRRATAAALDHMGIDTSAGPQPALDI